MKEEQARRIGKAVQDEIVNSVDEIEKKIRDEDKKKRRGSNLRLGIFFGLLGLYAASEIGGLDTTAHLMSFISGKPYLNREERDEKYISSKLEEVFKYDPNNNGLDRQEYRKYLEEH